MHFSLRLPALTALVAAIGAAALPAHADTLALDFSGGGGTTGNGTVGWAFNVLNPIQVTGLAVWDAGNNGLAGAHDVGIWSATRVLLVRGTVAAGTADPVMGFQFRVNTASVHGLTPRGLVLTPGTYRIGAEYHAEDNFRISASALSVAPDITYLDRYQIVGSSTLTYPTNQQVGIQYLLGPSFTYVPYTVPPPVPEPAAAGMLAVGIAALAWRMRRRGQAA